MPELDTFAKREAHARALARHYGLAPHAVEVRATLPGSPGSGRHLRVVWLDSAERLRRAGLLTEARCEALDAAVAGAGGRAGLTWVDAAGTHWSLSPNGGTGDQYGLWLTAAYPDEAETLAADAASPEFTRAVELMVRIATGRVVRFSDLRDHGGRDLASR
jgi:hypothetical protein